MEILVIKDGVQYGPFTGEEISTHVQEGSFQLTDICWQEGWAEWRALSTILSPQLPAVVRLPEGAPPSRADSTRAETEQVLWQGHANLWRYAGQFFWSSVIGLAIAIPTFGIGLLLIPFWWWLIFLERKKGRYFVSNKRVKVEYGLFVKSSREVRISDIRSVNVVKKGVAGLFGIGTLEFSSSGGAGVEISFDAIENAERVKRLVSDLQDR